MRKGILQPQEAKASVGRNMASPVRVIDANVWARGEPVARMPPYRPRWAVGAWLDDEYLDAGGLAAEGEALEETQYHQEDRCDDPGHGVGRQQADKH
jgi:hypothetical protein